MLDHLGLSKRSMDIFYQKKDQAIKINDNFFTSVELIEKVDTITKSKLLNIREFLRQIDENKEISDIANPLFIEQKNILNNKKIFKKTRKHLIFSILNITPDSFSDGGENLILKNNFLTALKMKADGADIIDIGGESTRPGAKKITPHKRIIKNSSYNTIIRSEKSQLIFRYKELINNGDWHNEWC